MHCLTMGERYALVILLSVSWLLIFFYLSFSMQLSVGLSCHAILPFEPGINYHFMSHVILREMCLVYFTVRSLLLLFLSLLLITLHSYLLV